MTNKENGTTTTMWQDNHSGRRKHKLMTKELGERIPALYTNESVENTDDVMARVKLFCPYSGWRWYITEWNAETGECFGLVQGFEEEWGYFDLTELATATVLGGVPAIERDLYWEPRTVGDIKRKSSGLAA